ncbi:MAG: GGDEF domain-containing protein [Candidatus Eremiobacteraeota bacterium]|nr:GGDEF domain-containing protein [Candidatus Eremiobacteraeota bacterium]
MSALRRIVAAARNGVDDVFRELDATLRGLCEEIEAVTVWKAEPAGGHRCVFASGIRYERYRGCVLDGLEARKTLHPSDRTGVCIALGDQTVLYLALARPVELKPLFDCCEIVEPALAVAYDRAEDRIRATYDGLTGLLTPRAFRTALAQLIRAIERTRGVPRLALLFIDTDRFKEWNDRLGHAAGDALLRKLAEMLRAQVCGPDDLVARNGGDEFCLVWADCEKSTAIERAEALRSTIAAAFADEAIAITASIGVAAFPVDGSGAEDLLEAADARMYGAKRAGRNRISWE